MVFKSIVNREGVDVVLQSSSVTSNFVTCSISGSGYTRTVTLSVSSNSSTVSGRSGTYVFAQVVDGFSPISISIQQYSNGDSYSTIWMGNGVYQSWDKYDEPFIAAGNNNYFYTDSDGTTVLAPSYVMERVKKSNNSYICQYISLSNSSFLSGTDFTLQLFNKVKKGSNNINRWYISYYMSSGARVSRQVKRIDVWNNGDYYSHVNYPSSYQKLATISSFSSTDDCYIPFVTITANCNTLKIQSYDTRSESVAN